MALKIRKQTTSPAVDAPAPKATKATKAKGKAKTRKAAEGSPRVPAGRKSGLTPAQFMVQVLFPENLKRHEDDEQLLARLTAEFPGWDRLERPGTVSLFRREFNHGNLTGQDGAPARPVPAYADGQALPAWGERGAARASEKPAAKVARKAKAKAKAAPAKAARKATRGAKADAA